jgi:hypothetical protein
MQSGSKLIEELVTNPQRFRAKGGYERMLVLLRSGRASSAVKLVLRDHSEIAGDVLWTVAQLDNVGAFVPDAVKHISSTDNGTAAYAMEIVLRGAQDPATLVTAMEQLDACSVVVCEHAVRTLAGEDLVRLTEIAKTLDGTWRALAENLTRNHIQRTMLEDLVSHTSRAHQVVGVALATLAYEQDESFAKILEFSTEGWVRQCGEWLVGK